MTGILATLPDDVRAMLEQATDDELSAIYHAGTRDDSTGPEREAADMAMAVLTERDEAQTRAREAAQEQAARDLAAAERKRAWRATPRGQEYTAAEDAWAEATHQEYLTAEAACPVLLSAAGLATGRNPHPMLWEVGEREFARLASDDFQRWVSHGELTVTRKADYMTGTYWARHSDNPWHEAGGEDMSGPESGGLAESAPGEAGTAQESPAGPGAGEDMPPADDEASGDAERRARILARGERRVALKARRAPAALPPGLTRKPTAAVAVPGSHLPPALRREAGYQVEDGAVLWDLVRTFLAHYVAFRGEAELDLVTAWTIAATARDRDDTGMGQLIWRAFPRLLVTSRKRGAGKSTVLDLILILTLSRRGKMPKVTPAKLAEVLGKYFETAAIDEAKAIFGAGKAHMELQGCLLAGYTRRASYEVAGKSYSLFGAVAYAAKEDLVTETNSGPDGGTIGDLIDRSLTVLQPPPSRPMPEVGERAEDDGERLGEALVTWTNDKRDELRAAAMQIADEDQARANGLYEAGEATGSPRMYQISRPLRAVARVAGPEAEEAVNRALAELTGGAASAKATADINELVTLSRAWRAAPDEDEGGQIVMDGTDDDEWED